MMATSSVESEIVENTPEIRELSSKHVVHGILEYLSCAYIHMGANNMIWIL